MTRGHEARGHGRERALAERKPRRDTRPERWTEFMAMALLMETEAAQRYAELADAMETHNNREVADVVSPDGRH